MAGETHHRAGPRTPGTVGRYGGKMYNGVMHWQRRLAWFLENEGISSATVVDR